MTGICRQWKGRSSFALKGARVHYAPDRPFRLMKIFFDITVDPYQKTLWGRVSQELECVQPLPWLHFDQEGLQIQKVQVGDQEASFEKDSGALRIILPKVRDIGDRFQVHIDYQVKHPEVRRGIYFFGPSPDHPQDQYQVWTQGQDEESRHWFPTLDYPNQKASIAMKVRVPRGLTAISNGALVTQQEQGEWVLFHYQSKIPQVTYLASLVVGEFAHWSEKGPRGLDLKFYVPRGKEEEGQRALGRTREMIEVFEKKLGVPYPYEKYSQVTVQHFIFGGIENTSATTLTDLALYDARAQLDYSSDALVAHELAHQWFGNWVTCRDWSHAWLNEGFATFMERVWIESDPGPRGGVDEAWMHAEEDWKHYLEEDAQYRRPVVCAEYVEPIDLFDAHLYQKGAWVLHLMRGILGDSVFWKVVQHYLTQHQGQCVETLDWIRAIEEVSGKNMKPLLDQWVFQAGYPEFEVHYQWLADTKCAEWILEQKQENAPIFQLPVEIQMEFSDGSCLRQILHVKEVRERFLWPVTEPPVQVRFDPQGWIPKKMKWVRSKKLALEQAQKASDARGRREALEELMDQPDAASLQACREALKDPFWGVRVQAAQKLGHHFSEEARQILQEALPHQVFPQARKAVVQALGRWSHPEVTACLWPIALSDPSYFVEAAALRAWVRCQLPLWVKPQTEVLKTIEGFLRKKLELTSYREVIRSAVLQAFGDCARVELFHEIRSVGFDLLLEWTQKNFPLPARGAAIRALGELLPEGCPAVRAQILQRFQQLSQEDVFHVRRELVSQLSQSGLFEAVPILEQIQRQDADGRIRRACQMGLLRLKQEVRVPEVITRFKASLDQLEHDYQTWKRSVSSSPETLLKR